ncbi:serine hydrolase [Thermaurantiacus tibetensis]|uniref:serine hydrolase n=1 Tax=Thermaurantiacus tibetensis TaxID=2759035 RepID=UPI00188DF359|nr:serine hydrolase [Thermaurantiacus tibetensis]
MTAPAEAGLPPCGDRLGAPVRAAIAGHLASGASPGLVVGLIGPAGACAEAFGSAGNRRLRVSDRFEIGSITKTFTALLLAERAGAGAVGLDTRLGDLLGAEAGGAAGVTLGQLASHRSGLPAQPPQPPATDPANPYARLRWSDLVAALAGFEPPPVASAYLYSNLGMGVLGEALARQAGMPWEGLLRRRLLRPLALGQIGTGASGLVPAHVGAARVPHWELPAIAGAGALRADSAAMLRWLALQLRPPAGPLGAAIRATHVPQGPTPIAGSRVALAWHVRETPGHPAIWWHNGGTGGHRSFVGFVPATGSGVVLLANGEGAPDAIGFHLLDAARPLPVPRAHRSADPADLAGLPGRYRLPDGSKLRVLREGEQLFVAGPEGGRTGLYAEGPGRFFLRALPLSVAVHHDGERVEALLIGEGAEAARADRLADPSGPRG